jgi:hypothetical protein
LWPAHREPQGARILITTSDPDDECAAALAERPQNRICPDYRIHRAGAIEIHLGKT